MKAIRTVVGLTVGILLLCSTLSVFAGGSSEDTVDTALLLGATSLEILFDRVAAQNDGSGTATIPFSELPRRIEIDTYISVLELTNVSYPDDPVGTTKNPAPLANYAQRIADQLDDVHRAAFLLGWFGAIDRRTNVSDPSICKLAEEAHFDTANCSGNPQSYYTDLLQTARTRTP